MSIATTILEQLGGHKIHRHDRQQEFYGRRGHSPHDTGEKPEQSK
jgi:hypothetical protein